MGPTNKYLGIFILFLLFCLVFLSVPLLSFVFLWLFICCFCVVSCALAVVVAAHLYVEFLSLWPYVALCGCFVSLLSVSKCAFVCYCCCFACAAETVLCLFASVWSQLCLSSVVWSHFMLFVYSLCILHLFQELSVSLCGYFVSLCGCFTDFQCSRSRFKRRLWLSSCPIPRVCELVLIWPVHYFIHVHNRANRKKITRLKTPRVYKPKYYTQN